MTLKINDLRCLCQSNLEATVCCERYISGDVPKTPLQLMRSRYYAYATKNYSYIQRTMTGPALKDFDATIDQTLGQNTRWLGLTILHTATKLNEAWVEFQATYLEANHIKVLHEVSHFIKVNDIWFYDDGVIKANQSISQKFGRNDSCPCGSKNKFKKCCGS